MTHPAPPDLAPPPAPWDAWLSAIAAAPSIDPPVSPEATVLAVAAHPDDEVIGAGRMLADHPGPTRCLTLTAGEACFGTEVNQDELAAQRLDEWVAAASVLGMEALDTTRWPDGRLIDHVSEASEYLMGPVADVDVIVAPWQHDPHPDHRAAGLIAGRVAGRLGVPLLAYPIWALYWLRPTDLPRFQAELVTCPTSERAEHLTAAALACHHSQLTPRPPATAPVVPAELVRRHHSQLLIRHSHAAD